MSHIHPKSKWVFMKLMEKESGPDSPFLPWFSFLHTSFFNEKNLKLIVLTVYLLIKNYLLMVITTILHDDQYPLPGFFLFVSLGWT